MTWPCWCCASPQGARSRRPTVTRIASPDGAGTPQPHSADPAGCYHPVATGHLGLDQARPRPRLRPNPTWFERELPVLEAIYRAEEEEDDHGFSALTVDGVAERTSLDIGQTRRTVRGLAEAGFITGNNASTLGGWDLMGIRLLERGRRAIGQWPTDDLYDELVELLQTQIAEETDPDRQSRLKRLLGAVTDVGKDVAGSVLAAWFREMVGLR
jgi:hypothetical protein